MLRADLVFFDAGGGHRAAATALKSVVEQQGRPWDLRMMNLQDVLDDMDVFRRYTGIRLADYYNRMLAGGWTLGSQYLLRGMQAMIRLYHRGQVRRLARHWTERRPDMVVSVVPNFNRALYQGLRRARADAPFVTILTDFADYPPHFWMERQDQFLICGTDRAVEQAREMGHPPERVFRTSGMILRPAFYRDFTHDRDAELRTLGLEPGVPTGLVLFGGQGSSQMVRIVRELAPLADRLQLILICGRNRRLAERLRGLGGRLRMHVVGFTEHVPHLMSLADFFIGKPGPGSISEAIAMKLPVVVERNAWTLPQERFNAEWVRQRDVGLVVRNFGEIGSAVGELLDPAVLSRMKRNAAAVKNRALFEIPEILEDIFRRQL